MQLIIEIIFREIIGYLFSKYKKVALWLGALLFLSGLVVLLQYFPTAVWWKILLSATLAATLITAFILSLWHIWVNLSERYRKR